MSPERYQKVKEIFQAALDRADADRGRFLDEVCAGDGDLRRAVEGLLASDERAGEFIDTPAAVSVARLLETPPVQDLVGQRIGPYEILSEIGRGGMGCVYLASRADDQYRKLVAIKLVNPGVESGPILARFLRERQILANLEHPNIAQLLDGGTAPDGRPYLVMEYVGGMPIDEYCESRRLPVAERLRLIRTVCAAVHHAHQNLVVHRDLKPSNILVKSDGAIKLLDFGIAKLLSPEVAGKPVERTATGMRVLTPDYASPEQVRGDPVTTASDVYTLGVVLYELLTGRRPFLRGGAPPGGTPPEKPSETFRRMEPLGTRTVEQIAEARQDTPRGLARKLAGDIDAITLTALQFNPADRYGSADKLSEDIQRHLDGLPVMVRPHSAGYLLAKFVHRYRAAVAAVVLGLALLAGGFVATRWQVAAEREERLRIERQLEETRRELERLRRNTDGAAQTRPTQP